MDGVQEISICGVSSGTEDDEYGALGPASVAQWWRLPQIV